MVVQMIVDVAVKKGNASVGLIVVLTSQVVAIEYPVHQKSSHEIPSSRMNMQ